MGCFVALNLPEGASPFRPTQLVFTSWTKWLCLKIHGLLAYKGQHFKSMGGKNILIFAVDYPPYKAANLSLFR